MNPQNILIYYSGLLQAVPFPELLHYRSHNHDRSTSDGRAAQPRPDSPDPETHLSTLIHLQDQNAKLSCV